MADPRFVVHERPQSPVGRTVVNRFQVLDTLTNSVVDEYTSRLAATSHADYENRQLLATAPVAPATAPPAKRQGRPLGQVPGSFASWLTTAKVGDTFWTERQKNGLISQASRAGRKVSLRQFVAVGDDAQAVRLVRITIVA